MSDLLHNITINADGQHVYDAVATQQGMQGWWTRDTTLEARVGGTAVFGFNHRGAVFHMTIDALEPGKLVQMSCSGDHPEWAGTTLEWTIEPTPEGTVLHFVHRGWRASTPFMASCNSTWGELMFRLKDYVETGRTNPHWTE